jgi:type I restriction enzyme S subunit
MIADLKPYAEYKESGLPWLGQVPGHWEVRRMKLLLREVDARSTAGKEQLLRVSQYTGVTRRKSVDGSDVPDTRASSLVGYKRVMPSDLVINIMLAWNGSMGVSRYDGIASPAYCVYRFKPGAIPWYYHELLRLPVYKGRIKTASTGVVESRLRLYSDDLGRIEVIQPPLVEQAAIVRFLDWANGRLERAIRAKRKVIALLNEQKQAIIHRAVTRGLDPSVPLKPSGIPWLGEIPQHWEVRRTKFIVDHYGPGIQMGPFGSSLTQLAAVDTGFKLFGQENTISGDFGRGNRWVTREQFEELRRYELQPGDIVLTRKGSIGKARLVPPGVARGIADSDKIRVRLDKRQVEPTFIVELLHTSTYVRRQIEATQRGAVLGGLNTATIGNLALVVPPLPEQLKLLMDLREATKDIVAGMGRIEREIDLLREYRTRLVADVVTGKLDVREAAARLPEDAALDNGDSEADLDPELTDEAAEA